jgi:hypothetical protein
MNRPRVSIARLMGVVAIVALDCGLVRLFLASVDGLDGLGAFGLAVSAGLIAMILGRGIVRRFAYAFTVWVVALLVALFGMDLVAGVFFPGTIEPLYIGYLNRVVRTLPLSWMTTAKAIHLGTTNADHLTLFALLVIEAAMSLPWLVLAAIGALVTCGRKPPSSPHPKPGEPRS